ncbi:IclR family transcriptional regulator [Corynebacterium sp. HMSC05H05]|nr:IclR family transcriptional regulator [Corynebacterium sp. HMSC05H05]
MRTVRQYNEGSGIKVLDRAVAIVAAVASGDKSLAELSDATELPRATAHRIATALEVHHVLARNERGEWSLGPALPSYTGGPSPKLLAAAAPVLRDLVETTGESAQLYQLTGTTRTCIAAEEPESGLHNVVPVGSHLTLTAGSAARVFAAYSLIDATAFPADELATVTDTGLAESVAEREVGLASVSAPVFGPDRRVAAVLSVSGPAERLGPSPAAKWGAALKDATARLSAEL